MIQASIQLTGEPAKTLQIPVQGKVSDGIRQLKAEAGAVFTAYLTKHNLSKEEVNIMEEVISEGEDGDEATAGKRKKGVKRKKAAS